MWSSDLGNDPSHDVFVVKIPEFVKKRIHPAVGDERDGECELIAGVHLLRQRRDDFLTVFGIVGDKLGDELLLRFGGMVDESAFQARA